MGGTPILRDPARLPVTLPSIELDTTEAPHGAGYHYSASLAEAARASGFWPNGRPARCVSVVASSDTIERQLVTDYGFDDHVTRIRRASALTITALCADDEVRAAMHETVSWARTAVQIVEEQWAWYLALGRPRPVEETVVEGLQVALAHRQLDWTLKRFGSAKEAWAARSQELHWPTLNEGDAWDRGDDWPDGGDWDEVYWQCPVEPNLTLGEWRDQWYRTLDAWEAQWDRWDPWDVYVANQAKAALSHSVAVAEGWDSKSHCGNCLSDGVRDAYYHGLAIAVPTGPRELGYAMDRSSDAP